LFCSYILLWAGNLVLLKLKCNFTFR
jgi:hypothetical protein